MVAVLLNTNAVVLYYLLIGWSAVDVDDLSAV